jgi:hypothetical protein
VNSQITVLRVEPKGSGSEGEELTARVLKQKIEVKHAKSECMYVYMCVCLCYVCLVQ